MGSKPKASQYKASQTEKDAERVAKADAAYFKKTYDPLLLEMRDQAATEKVAPTLRGRAQADTMQALTGQTNLGLVQGLGQSANLASGAISQMLGANVAAKGVKTAQQTGVLGTARGQAADAGDALAQASRMARSEGLAKAKAKQDIRLSRRAMMYDLGKAGGMKALQNKSETGDWRYSKGAPKIIDEQNNIIAYETSGGFLGKSNKVYDPMTGKLADYYGDG